MPDIELTGPDLIGRKEELERLEHVKDSILSRNGKTVLISGEAGIGKTRLCSEFIERIERDGGKVVKGWCLPGNLDPLHPLKGALKDANLYHLISEDPPPLVLSSYLIDDSGLLIYKEEREETGLDPDIFASMLTAVENFVKDSLSMMWGDSGKGLSGLAYDKYKILLRKGRNLSLAVVIEGTENEFLIDDMDDIIRDMEEKLPGGGGGVDEIGGEEKVFKGLIESGRYEGRYVVDDPKVRQENLFDNILMGFQRLAINERLVIFIDDIQWADPTTLLLLHYLSRNISNHKICILGTYRPEDISKDEEEGVHPLERTLQNMNREGLIESIELERLGKEETADAIRSMLKESGMTKDFIDKIYEETKGNPLFVFEIVKLLVEEDKIKVENGEVVSESLHDLDIPSRIMDVIERRMDKLSDAEYDILECASILGENFRSRVIGEILNINRIILLKNLNNLENDHGLIKSSEDIYLFDHSKIREYIYGNINKELRVEYHRVAAESYIDLYDEEEFSTEIGVNFYKANDERGFPHLIRSAKKAQDKYANEESVELYNMALEVCSDENEKNEIYRNMGDIYKLMGEMEKSLDSYERALEGNSDIYEIGEIYCDMSDIFERTGDYEGGLDACDRGIEVIQGEKTKELSKLYGCKGWIYLNMGDFDRSYSMLTKSVQVAEDIGDEKYISEAYHLLGTFYHDKGDYNESIEMLKRALELREENEDERGISASTNNLGVVYWSQGRLDDALRCFKRSFKIAKKLGDKYSMANSLNNIGLIETSKGEVDTALDHFEEGLNINRRMGDMSGIAMSLDNIGYVKGMVGDYEKSLENRMESLRIEREVGNKHGQAASLENISGVYYMMGEYEKALEYYKKAKSVSEEIGDKHQLFDTLCSLIKFFVYRGKTTDVESNMKQLQELEDSVDSKYSEERYHRTLGIYYRETERYDKAEQEFDNSEKILEEVGDNEDIGMLNYEMGKLYGMKGERDKEKYHFEKALDIFDMMGMKVWKERTEEELRACENYPPS
ncbi:MAG: tetratricopeptide repeat protein [Thermoplasmata archaeon]